MTGLRIERLLPPDFLACALREDARAGLTATPKSLPPKWFYDATGSALFEKITELPEYYPTNAERAILRAAAGQIAAASRARTLVELGSGSSDKTRLLLDALRAAGTLHSYVPVDVSETALAEAGRRLAGEYRGAVRARHGLGLRAPSRVAGGRGRAVTPDDRLPRQHHRQHAARTSARSSWRGSGPPPARATRCCSVPTWSRIRPSSWPPTTTRPVSRPRSTRTCWQCSTPNSAPTSTWTPSST